MKRLLSLVLAMSFVGAQCGTPTGLTYTCTGSKPQTLHYTSEGSCGGTGNIIVSVATAGSCAVSVEEEAGIGLPGTGSFNSTTGATTGFDLAKGSWNLQDVPSGPMSAGVYLNCTGGAASASGAIQMVCSQQVCQIGDDDNVDCMTGTTCMTLLTPAPNDAGISVEGADAATGSADAGETVADATVGG